MSIHGTPLKAIDNICTSSVSGALYESGNGTSISSASHLTFLHPQQTSTPAAGRVSPRRAVSLARAVPASAVRVLLPMPSGERDQRHAVLSRADGVTCGFSQDGGFLPESQPVGLTPAMPFQTVVRHNIVDLTADDGVADTVTESQFKPGVVSTQMYADPITVNGTSNRHLKVRPANGIFENSFATNVAADAKTETKFGPDFICGNRLLELCQRNGNFDSSFVSETLPNRMTESDRGGNAIEAGEGSETIPVAAESRTAAENKEDIVSLPRDAADHAQFQRIRSRSSSPELFDGEDAATEKFKASAFEPPSSNVGSSSTKDPCDKPLASDDGKTANSSHQMSLPHTTLAQKLASKKLTADDSTVNDPRTITCSRAPPRGETMLPATKTSLTGQADVSLMNDTEQNCAQTRRSVRLSTRCKTSLHSSKVRSRGVDFLDEIDEVSVFRLMHSRCIFCLQLLIGLLEGIWL